MDKKQMDSELALLEIETLVSNYTKTEVDIFISILCVRFMKEHNIKYPLNIYFSTIFLNFIIF